MQFHLIDDEKQVGMALYGMLDVLGYQVRLFHCPLEYLEYAKSADYEKPEAVITDIDMPGLNGYQLIEALRREHEDLKFVIISAFIESTHPAVYEACMFFSKPIRLQTLKMAVSALVDCHRSGPHPDNCSAVTDRNRLPEDWKCRHCAHA